MYSEHDVGDLHALVSVGSSYAGDIYYYGQIVSNTCFGDSQ